MSRVTEKIREIQDKSVKSLKKVPIVKSVIQHIEDEKSFQLECCKRYKNFMRSRIESIPTNTEIDGVKFKSFDEEWNEMAHDPSLVDFYDKTVLYHEESRYGRRYKRDFLCSDVSVYEGIVTQNNAFGEKKNKYAYIESYYVKTDDGVRLALTGAVREGDKYRKVDQLVWDLNNPDFKAFEELEARYLEQNKERC